MPLLKQGAGGLWKTIAKLTGDSSITRDMGYCAPTSSTMGWAALVKEFSGSHITFGKVVKKLKNTKSHKNIDRRTKNFARNIYDIGLEMGTYWSRGGTSTVRKDKAFEAFQGRIKVTKGKAVTAFGKQHLKDETDFLNEDMINLFRKHKPVYAVSFGTYEPSGRTHKRAGGHALVMNGYEDGYIKIYDPWGKVYNVTLKKATGKGIKGRSQVRHVSGDRGFVKAYGAKKTILFDSYVYAYAHKKFPIK